MTRDHERALAAFLARATLRNLAPSTVAAHEDVIRRFLSALGTRRVASVTTDDVRAYLAVRTTVTKGIDRELGILRAFFEAALREGATLPTAGIKARRASTGARLFLSRPVVEKILVAASDSGNRGRAFKKLRAALAFRDRAIVELLYALGLRASEVSAARLADLDVDGGRLLARRAKRGRGRFLPLPHAAVPHLERYVREGRPVLVQRGRDDEGALFVTFRGLALTTSGLQGVVAKLARLAGERAHPHAFRRGLATDLVHGGASVPAVQELLGHKSLTTTAIYVDVNRDDLRRAVEKLDARREEVRPSSRRRRPASTPWQSDRSTRRGSPCRRR